MKRTICHFFIFSFFICLKSSAFSQNDNLYTIPDSLLNKSDVYLKRQAKRNYNDTAKIIIYYSSLLTKATINKDSINRIQALSYLAYFQKEKNRKIELIETALSESEGKQDVGLVSAYNTAGIIYYNLNQYDITLKNYFKALELAERYNHSSKYFILNNIAGIKKEIGKYKEALELYKKNLLYRESSPIKDSLSITNAKVMIAESLVYLKRHDSASYFHEEIIKTPFDHPYFPIYRDIANINEGINLFDQHKYLEAKERLEKTVSQMSFNTISEKYYILSQFYLGKINLILEGDEMVTERYFLKVDSLLTITNRVIPNTKEIYELFIKKYEEREEYPAQIKAINKLIVYDSIISTRKINTVNTLHSQFDVPELLKSREIALDKLRSKNSSLSNRTIYLVLSIFILLFLVVFQYSKHTLYKRRFNKLIEKPNIETKNIKLAPISKAAPKKLNIDEKLIAKILEQLEQFEKKQSYTKRDITINSLAKGFATNTRYLSKIINTYKQKNFTHYINDLRIDYILEELKNKTILQQHTIKSISEEAGFNTAESFVTAFRKKTGLKPSYFIRNIKKLQ